MSKAISRHALETACADAVRQSEDLYCQWTDGISMRSAPESLVQTQIAQHLANAGAIVFLETSVRDILKIAAGGIPDGNERGRVDIAVYYKSKNKRACPRFVIEVKKLTTHHSLDQDFQRIVELLKRCPDIQNGIMVGYGTAMNEETAIGKVEAVTEHLQCKRVLMFSPKSVTGLDGRQRFLAAGVFRVGRN